MENNAQAKNNKMGVMPVGRLLITMSLPMMASMLIQALYNVVDSIFVSRISENALTAVSLAFPMQSLMIAFGVGVAVGINALLSQSLGKKDQITADKAANNGILLGLVSYVIFLIAGVLFAETYMLSQTDVEEIVRYGTDYLRICMIFSMGIFGQLIFERILQSTGRTFLTMITHMIGAVINIVLDPILIFGLLGFPKLGVTGAAIATVTGQIVSAAVALIFNFRYNTDVKLSLRDMRPDKKVIGRICAVGIPTIIMQSTGSVMSYFINKILITFTTTANAVFGVYFRMQSIAFLPVFGLTHGIVPIIAFNYGAKKRDRLIQAIKFGMIYASTFVLMAFILVQLLAPQIFAVFNASEQLLEIGVPALRIISLSFLFAGISFVTISALQALGYGLRSMFISFIRQLIVLLPAAYLLSLTRNLGLVWWAFPLAETVSAAASIIFLVHTVKKLKV